MSALRVLSVGSACVDVVLTVDAFPEEDSKVAVTEKALLRGGNSANLLEVLAQFKSQPSGMPTFAPFLMATLGDCESDPMTQFLVKSMESCGVDVTCCMEAKLSELPTSYIARSIATGSRTILHHRTAPEINFEHFRECFSRVHQAGSPWRWVHFEGRAVETTARCMSYVCSVNEQGDPDRGLQRPRNAIGISLELEKPDRPLETLVHMADTIFVSKSFATGRGCSSAVDFLAAARAGKFGPIAIDTAISCTWGNAGAWVMERGGSEAQHCPTPTVTVVNTIGAGDSYNAVMIAGLCTGLAMGEAAALACRIASRKVAQQGFQGIVDRGVGVGANRDLSQ